MRRSSYIFFAEGGETLIKLENVSVRLGKKTVLDSFSASFERGKISAVIGRNGCGKTTMLRAVSNFLKFDGNIELDSKDVKDYSREELAKRLAFMPQRVPSPHVRVRELVAFGRSPHLNHFGYLSKNDKNTVMQTLNECDCLSLADKYADELSGGELRKVFFAMMLCTDADVFLLDEPTANLDAVHKRMLLDLLKDLCEKKNKTVIVVLHDVNDALSVCDRIVALESGKCLFEGDIDEMQREEIPQKLLSLSPFVSIDKNGKENIFYR